MRLLLALGVSCLSALASAQSYKGQMRAATYTGDASALTYSSSSLGAVPYFSNTGSSLTFNTSGLYFDPINRRLGIRQPNPTHGLECSSCTLYLDGNSPNPIQVGNNGSTMTLTSGGALTIASSMTASAFLGSPAAMSTGYVIVASSYVASTETVATTAFVGIATVTINSRGSRPLVVSASTNINNGAGGNRDYTCQLSRNSVLQDSPRVILASGGHSEIMVLTFFNASSLVGPTTFALLCKTSDATAAQSAGTTSIIAEEF